MGISEIMLKGIKFTITHEFFSGKGSRKITVHPPDLIIDSIKIGSVDCDEIISNEVKESLKKEILEQYI